MVEGLRIALVGCGVIAQRTLPGLLALLKVHQGTISAVCDPIETNRKHIAQSCDNKAVAEFGDFEALLSDSNCNVVFVATPIGMHFSQVQRALDSGRHVYCHKTLAASEEECGQLANLADSKGLKLAASPGQMLLPVYARARDLVGAGELGDLVSIDASTEAVPHRHEPERAGETPSADDSYSWEWYHKRALGGGPLADMFVYPLAFLTDLLGDVTRAAARARTVRPRIEWWGKIVEADAPDSYVGLLEFANVVASFRASFSANGRKVPWGTICIRGTDGCLEIEKRNDAAYRLYLTPNDGSARVERYGVFVPDRVDELGSVECHVLTDMAELLSACVEGRSVRGATAINAARVARAQMAIERSADRNGAWVEAGERIETN